MISLTLIGLFILGLYLILRKPKRNLPPGPRSLPIIGNVHQLDRTHPYKTLTTWAEDYGDIFLFKQFADNVVVVNNYELIQEVLVSKSTEFAGRPKNNYRAFSIFGEDISFANFSPQWVLAKKSAMLALKMYGDGLANLEELSLEFIGEMIDRLKQCLATDSSVDIKSEVHECTTGIMASVVSGGTHISVFGGGGHAHPGNNMITWKIPEGMPPARTFATFAPPPTSPGYAPDIGLV